MGGLDTVGRAPAGQMIPLALAASGPLRVVALGAHADDLEIGAGGLLAMLAASGADVTWVVLSAAGVRAGEARASAEALLAGAASRRIEVHATRERYFPYDTGLKERFDGLGGETTPDLVLAPRLEDRHQDHATVASLAWQTFRGSLILEYEIPKYEGDLGSPNVYVAMSPDAVEAKVRHLMAAFPSQVGRTWYTEDAFRGILRLRGIESGAPQGHAEAFTARKILLDPAARAGR